MSTVDHPPLEVVRAIVEALESRGIPVAVGGSAVLAARGLIDRVGDWDVIVDADPDVVRDLLDALGLRVAEDTVATPPFATRARFVIDAGDHDLDVLVGFALRDGEEIVAIPARAASRWLDLPIADPADWALAYRLMGRVERAASLRRNLDLG